MPIEYDITYHPEWWHQEAGIDFAQPFFDEPQVRIEADIKMRRTLFEKFGSFGLGSENPEPRPLLGTNLLAAGYLHSEVLGCRIKYAPNNSPVVVPQDLDIEELSANLSYRGLEASSVWQRTEKQIAFLQREYGRVESHINLMGVQNIAMDILGQELMTAYYEYPDELHTLLRIVTDCILDIGKRLNEVSDTISEGVTAIIGRSRPKAYLTSNCSCEMIPNKLYEEFLLPYDRELAAAFTSFGIHHCGASMEHVCAGYSKVPNLDFLEVGAGSNVAEVRKHFPDTFLNLRVSPVTLNDSNESELHSLIESLIAAGNNSTKQVSISCVGIGHNVSDDKIRTFLSICNQINL